MFPKIVLYIVTILGAVGLVTCMMDFKYKIWVEALVGTIASLACLAVAIIVNHFIKDEIGTYYSVILFSSIAICAVCLFALSKDKPVTTAFAIITQTDSIFIIGYAAKTIAILCNDNVWIEIVIRAVAFAIIIVVYKFWLRQKYRDFADNYKETTGWVLLTMIPIAYFAVFYVITIYPTVMYLRPNYMHLIMLMVILSMVATYGGIFTTFKQILEKNKIKIESEKANFKVEYWKQQIELQDTIIENAKQTRHDLRHHDMLLMRMLKEGNTDKALEYLANHGTTIDDGVVFSFCENYIVNCIFTAYINRAKKEGIEVECEANIPKDISIDDVELAGVIANLLENAVEACGKIQNPNIKKYIHITIHYQTGSLRILVVNSCNSGVAFDGQLPVSTKAAQSGIGTKSVSNVAKEHNGIADFSEAAGVFTARVLLNLDVK